VQALHTQLHELCIALNILYNVGSLIVVLIQYGVLSLSEDVSMYCREFTRCYLLHQDRDSDQVVIGHREVDHVLPLRHHRQRRRDDVGALM